MWASFNTALRRIHAGGWARQVTQADFFISESISGVNMRLDAGGLREPHWHLAAKRAYMSHGNARITVLDPQGRAYVADVKEGGLWHWAGRRRSPAAAAMSASGPVDASRHNPYDRHADAAGTAWN